MTEQIYIDTQCLGCGLMNPVKQCEVEINGLEEIQVKNYKCKRCGNEKANYECF